MSAEPLYDIQGKRITVGCLVAYVSGIFLLKDRVEKIMSVHLVTTNGGCPHHLSCAVLEEPVWPN